MPFAIIAFAILLGFFFTILYNRLVSLSNARQEAFADIEVQLIRRHDLIKSLVEVASTYTGPEDKLNQHLASTIAQCIDSEDLESRVLTESKLTEALVAARENYKVYTDLIASEQYSQIQQELGLVEQQITGTRKHFNSISRDYNLFREQWPAKYIANWNDFNVAAYFNLSQEEKAAFSKTAAGL